MSQSCKTILLLALALAGCGQTGDLYLPGEAVTPAATPSPDATEPESEKEKEDEESP